MAEIKFTGELKRTDIRSGDRFIMTMDRPLSTEQCRRIQEAWRAFVGDASDVSLFLLPFGATLEVLHLDDTSSQTFRL